MDETDFLPDIATLSAPFNTKLFKSLFYVPDIVFFTGGNESFPKIPEKYVYTKNTAFTYVPLPKTNEIVCYTNPNNVVILKYYDAPLIGYWHAIIETYAWGGTWRKNILFYFSDASNPHLSTKLAFDKNILAENIYIIAESLSSKMDRKTLDDSIYTIQKNRIIKKYSIKYLLIDSIDCFSIVKHVLIQTLINLEHDDENSHVQTIISPSN